MFSFLSIESMHSFTNEFESKSTEKVVLNLTRSHSSLNSGLSNICLLTLTRFLSSLFLISNLPAALFKLVIICLNTCNQDDISAPFSLQSGAFSSEINATSQRTELVISGFRARVKELYKSDKTLYAVRIGYFNNREDALKVGEQIKTKLDLDTIIIKNK